MIPGQRFEVDLDDDNLQIPPREHLPSHGAHVGDILERKPTAAAPAPPSLKPHSTGFPEHRKRKVESRFKQQKNQSPSLVLPHLVDVPAEAIITGKAKSWEEEEKQRIDLENRQKLADMSPAEIEEARSELLSNLNPALVQRLLQRANINSGSAEADLLNRPIATKKEATTKSVAFADPEPTERPEPTSSIDQDAESILLAADGIHFPHPRQPPALDPSSATFLTDLHEKYFPSLPSDPDKLEWMQSSSRPKNGSQSDYSASAASLSPAEIRFSFTGELLPPRTAASIPVTAGLHHHGDAPDAAGYTIPELAHLGQSSYAAQRCIAFQTLGRILYRLGRGEFGDSGERDLTGAVDERVIEDVTGVEDTFGELARGLWREMEREKVLEILVMASEGKGADRGRHLSAQAYATEALWLWRKGGGRRWKAE